MIRATLTVLALLFFGPLAFADSDVKIVVKDGAITQIGVSDPPPYFREFRNFDFSIDGKKVTEAQVVALTQSGEKYRVCDIADHFALFTVHTSPDGTVNYWHSDGVFRPGKPEKYASCSCASGCKCTPEDNCGCGGKKASTGKPPTIIDTQGNTYTLGADGYYRSQPGGTVNPTCPNGRCPNR